MKKISIIISILLISVIGVFAAVTPSSNLNGFNQFNIFNYKSISGNNGIFTNLSISNPPTACPAGYFMTFYNGSNSECVSNNVSGNIEVNSINNIKYVNTFNDLKNAVESANTSYNTLIIINGNIEFTDTIVANGNITIDAENSKLTLGNSINKNMFNVTGNRFFFYGGFIDGNKGSNTIGDIFYIYNLDKGFRLENTYIDNCADTGITVGSNSWTNYIKNVYVNNCNNYGLNIEGSNSNDWEISGFVGLYNGVGMRLGGGGYHRISHADLYLSETNAIELRSSYNNIVNSVIEGSGIYNIDLFTSSNNIISDNSIRYSSLNSNNTYSEIIITSGNNNIISNNIFNSATSSLGINQSKYTVRIQSGNNNNLVINNKIVTAGVTAKYYDAGTTNLIIDQNGKILKFTDGQDKSGWIIGEQIGGFEVYKSDNSGGGANNAGAIYVTNMIDTLGSHFGLEFWTNYNGNFSKAAEFEPDNDFNVYGHIKAEDYYSGDGTQGMTGTCGSSTTLTIKDGLVTACS